MKNNEAIRIAIAETSVIIRGGLTAALKRLPNVKVQPIELLSVEALSDCLRTQYPEMLIVNPTFGDYFDVNKFREETAGKKIRLIALVTSFVDASLLTKYDDSNAGTLDKPFATLQKAQSKVVPGDTVYIRGGEYRIREEQMMGGDHLRAYVFEMNKSGTQAKRICYTGYQDERPIFNLTEVKPEGKRLAVCYVSGSYLHFRNFEIIKTQVTIRSGQRHLCEQETLVWNLMTVC